MGIQGKVEEAVRHISLEPVFFLVCVSNGLIRISVQALYMDKACQVNLVYPQEICQNVNNHTQIHQETQKLVSEVQAYNGMLQSAPAIIFTLFAGPLSDTYGRKFLIIFALFGYFILNIVFLINSFWFYELPVSIMLDFVQKRKIIIGAPAIFKTTKNYLMDPSL